MAIDEIKRDFQVEHDKVWEIVHLVRQYVPGSVNWIATQKPYEDGLTGFTIGNGYAHVHYTDLDRRDDEFIRQVAGQILGFPVDSPQDIERRRQEIQEQIDRLKSEIKDRQERLDHWLAAKAVLNK